MYIKKKIESMEAGLCNMEVFEDVHITKSHTNRFKQTNKKNKADTKKTVKHE